jgi:hypothetical protein
MDVMKAILDWAADLPPCAAHAAVSASSISSGHSVHSACPEYGSRSVYAAPWHPCRAADSDHPAVRGPPHHPSASPRKCKPARYCFRAFALGMLPKCLAK